MKPWWNLNSLDMELIFQRFEPRHSGDNLEIPWYSSLGLWADNDPKTFG